MLPSGAYKPRRCLSASPPPPPRPPLCQKNYVQMPRGPEKHHGSKRRTHMGTIRRPHRTGHRPYRPTACRLQVTGHSNSNQHTSSSSKRSQTINSSRCNSTNHTRTQCQRPQRWRRRCPPRIRHTSSNRQQRHSNSNTSLHRDRHGAQRVAHARHQLIKDSVNKDYIRSS